MGALPGEMVSTLDGRGNDATHSMPRTAACPRVVLSMKVMLRDDGCEGEER